MVVVVVVPYLFNEVDALLKIHAEVDELPLDSFLPVLLLLEDEHVMVEELLQTLVGVVDAQLLERVVLNTAPGHTQTYRSATDANCHSQSVSRPVKFTSNAFGVLVELEVKMFTLASKLERRPQSKRTALNATRTGSFFVCSVSLLFVQDRLNITMKHEHRTHMPSYRISAVLNTHSADRDLPGKFRSQRCQARR